jgi:hypothetical protein
MKTGFDPTGSDNDMYESHLKTLVDIVTPVVERAIVLSCEYAKACGRDAVVSKDFEYAAKYCAMRTVGQHIGSFFPEIYNDTGEDEDEDIDDLDIIDDDSIEFVRYSGDDPAFKAINEAYDAWDSWKPQSPVEELLKNAINSNEHCGGMVNE